jgi:competence protein ComEC
MKPWLIFSALILLSTVGLLLYQYHKFHDGKLHVIFCNVGQGDGILIRTPRGTDIIYDGGPDRAILSCLTDHLPFWDRSIELMVLSHPHADHLIGLLSVMKRYTVSSFDTERLTNRTSMYTALEELLKVQHTKTRNILAGDRFSTKDGVVLEVLGPTQKYLIETSPNGMIGEKKEFASVVLRLTYGKFDVLLSGDSQVLGLSEALGELGRLGGLGSIEVLHVPHHGSGYGLDQNVLELLGPKLAVISVGKNNYGHPAKSTLQLLESQGIKVMRTDRGGEIEIVSDGKRWEVR